MNNKNDHTAAAGDELTLRAADPAVQTRDMQSRTMTLRAATLDESARSVEVTMCTENPTTVYAPGYGIIDEVLVADGGEFPAQLPLLEVHNRYSLDAVLGSVRNIRRDGATWVGRAFFAEGNERADTAWNMVRQGHLTAVSLGYLQTAGVEIPRGQTNNIAGRSFTAGTQRSLLVTTRYAAKECSLVPVGADKATTVRGEAEASPITAGATRTEHPMDPLLRTFLVSLGLRADATLEQAQAFHGELAGNFKTRADAIVAKTMTLEQATAQSKVEIDAVRSIIQHGAGTTAAVTTPATTLTPATQPTQRQDPGSIASQTHEQIRAGERDRLLSIRTLAGPSRDEVPADLVERAEREGWTVERASSEFLKHMRQSRSPALGNDAPAGIVRQHERDATRSSIGLAMAMRSGVNVEQWGKRNAVKIDNLAQQAQRYSDMSLLDVCREALRLDGREIPVSRDETIRAAVSGASLTQIFTTSVNAVLLQAYEEEPDTTVWVEEGEVADFKTNTAIRFAGNAGLEKLGRGNTAKHASAEDSAETYKVARYAKQFVADEQDIIDDSMNALSDMPREFGQAARRLRPDLVYAMVLNGETATMADTGTVFNSTALTTAGGHANYAAAGTDILGGALSANSLQLAIVAMRKQYRGTGRNKVQLNIVPEFLLVPPESPVHRRDPAQQRGALQGQRRRQL
jgi:hypothetical protein